MNMRNVALTTSWNVFPAKRFFMVLVTIISSSHSCMLFCSTFSISLQITVVFFCLFPGFPHPHHIPSASVYPPDPRMPHSKLPHMQQYMPSYMNPATHFPFPYPPHPASPKPAHAPLSRLHSSPSYSLSSPSSVPGSPSPFSSDVSSPVSDVNLMSPPPTHTPTMWPPHTQPLFSLANMLSMAMSMAHSFMPTQSLAQAMPGFQPGYPAMYAPQYPPSVPAEVAYNQGMAEYYQTLASQFRDTAMSSPSRATPTSASPSSISTSSQQTASTVPQEGMLYTQESSKEYPHGYRPAFPRHLLEQRSSPGSSSGRSSSSRASPDSRVSLILCQSVHLF